MQMTTDKISSLYNLASVHCSCSRIWLLPFLNCLFWLKTIRTRAEGNCGHLWPISHFWLVDFAVFRLTVNCNDRECCRAECTLYRECTYITLQHVHWTAETKVEISSARQTERRERERQSQSKTARLGRLEDSQVESVADSALAPDAQSEHNWAVVSHWPSVAISFTLHSWVPPSFYCFVCFALSLVCLIVLRRRATIDLECHGSNSKARRDALDSPRRCRC